MADNALLDMDYQTMIEDILEEKPLHELDKEGELFKLSSERQFLGVWTFKNGSRLVVKNSSEVVVPKGEDGRQCTVGLGLPDDDRRHPGGEATT